MCTAITYKTEDFYFGRTLDYEFLYPCEVVVTPRKFPFRFRFLEDVESHYAMAGMAYVCENYPMYFDCMNEQGLCMAGLNFVGNAVYREAKENALNVAQFELIPFVLSRCKSVKDARTLLQGVNITNTRFSEDLPVSDLHWIVSDKNESITLEAVKEGFRIYENSVGVLTNNPPFPYHKMNLNNYMNLSPKPAKNRFSDKAELSEYSRGMGAMGLPGDLSSQSRFVRASFAKLNSVYKENEAESVSQFFHIMDTVTQVEGCCELSHGVYEKTQYTCCLNADKGIYYYTTYENRGVSAVNMYRENLDSEGLIRYPLQKTLSVNFQN